MTDLESTRDGYMLYVLFRMLFAIKLQIFINFRFFETLLVYFGGI